eukprot:s11329_g1.t1
MCKAGQFNMSERQIIGHHLDRPSTSALTYGRANCVGPLGKVAVMLAKIQDGSFRPDASAARLIEQQLHQEEVASDELERKLHGEPCTLEDSASDDLGHDDADQAAVDAVPSAERRMVLAPSPSQYLVHLSSGMLHAIASGSERFRDGGDAQTWSVDKLLECLMSVDSQAAFRAEAIRLGVSEAHADLLINKGSRNHPPPALTSSYQPGASDEKPFVDALVAKLGEEAKESLPAFRHLFYTSHTLAVQELKDKLEPREEAKRLSMADRVDRLERLRKSLIGITIDTWTLWVLVAQETRGKVLTSGTPLPIDAAVDAFKDAPDDKLEPREEAKRLSMADRVDRLERLRKSLIGITIDTWLEPSHALVDKAVGFAEEQCLGPLDLSKCTSREAEMRSEKRDPETFRLEKLNI